MCLYQVSLNYSPGVKFGPARGCSHHSFHMGNIIKKTLEISLNLAMRPSISKILHVAVSNGPLPREPKL